jgi:hypothetical protein
MRHDSGHHRKHVERYNRKCGGKYDGKHDRKHNAIHSRLAISLHRRDCRSIVGFDCRHCGTFWIGCFFNAMPNGWSDRYKRPAVKLSCGQKFRVEV